jgi:hypothetical protein
MKLARWLSRGSLAVGCLLPATGAAEWSHAGLRETIGPPRAPHAMPGVDATRSHRTATRLGVSPRVERRFRIAYGVGRGLVTHEDGGLFVLHPAARASRFDAQGKLVYSFKLPGEASSPPVVTSSGRSAFVAAGELQLVDDRGQLRAHTPLGDADFRASSILASRDGGVVVANNGWLIKLSAAGDLVWRQATSETPLDLLETDAGLWCVTAPGSIYRVDGAGRMVRVGELGGTTQAVSADGATLLARTGAHRLVSFDLVQHEVRAAVEDGTLELGGPVLVGHDALAQAFTSDGLLVRYRADGSEAQRIPIDPGARRPPGMEDALLLPDGRLLVARAGADVAIVMPSGEVSSITNSACPDPVGLYAAGARAVLLACRSGNMLRLE